MKKKNLKKYIFSKYKQDSGGVGGHNIWRQSKVIDENSLQITFWNDAMSSLSSVFFRIGSLKKEFWLRAYPIEPHPEPRRTAISSLFLTAPNLKKNIM